LPAAISLFDFHSDAAPRTAHPGGRRHDPRALIAKTIDPIAVLTGRGSAGSREVRSMMNLAEYQPPTGVLTASCPSLRAG
jgi:hypothetical protein